MHTALWHAVHASALLRSCRLAELAAVPPAMPSFTACARKASGQYRFAVVVVTHRVAVPCATANMPRSPGPSRSDGDVSLSALLPRLPPSVSPARAWPRRAKCIPPRLPLLRQLCACLCCRFRLKSLHLNPLKFACVLSSRLHRALSRCLPSLCARPFIYLTAPQFDYLHQLVA
jgi:hypothetical protein